MYMFNVFEVLFTITFHHRLAAGLVPGLKNSDRQPGTSIPGFFSRPEATYTDLQLIIDVHFVLYYISMYVSSTEEGPAPVRQSGRGLDEDRPLPQPSRAPEDLRTQEGGG